MKKILTLLSVSFFVLLITILINPAIASADIRKNCEKKWEGDHKMVDYCIREQTQAKKLVRSAKGYGAGIKQRCTTKWGDDYKMVKYCMDRQLSSEEDLKKTSVFHSKKQMCQDRWGNNYEMVMYCIDKDHVSEVQAIEIDNIYDETDSSGETERRERSNFTAPSSAVKQATVMKRLPGSKTGLQTAQCKKCKSTIGYYPSMSGSIIKCSRCLQPKVLP